MKVYEVTESKQKLDEVAFLAPLVAPFVSAANVVRTAYQGSKMLRASWTIVKVALEIWGIYETVELAKEAKAIIDEKGFDTSKWTVDDWIVIVLLIVFGRLSIKGGWNDAKELAQKIKKYAPDKVWNKLSKIGSGLEKAVSKADSTAKKAAAVTAVGAGLTKSARADDDGMKLAP